MLASLTSVTRCGLLRLMGVMVNHEATDRELLLKGDAAAFAVFYDRHAEWVLGFLRRRSPDGEAAADLAAEVFAAALSGRRRYRSENASAHAWLLAIASNKLNSALRSGYAERRARTATGDAPRRGHRRGCCAHRRAGRGVGRRRTAAGLARGSAHRGPGPDRRRGRVCRH